MDDEFKKLDALDGDEAERAFDPEKYAGMTPAEALAKDMKDATSSIGEDGEAIKVPASVGDILSLGCDGPEECSQAAVGDVIAEGRKQGCAVYEIKASEDWPGDFVLLPEGASLDGYLDAYQEAFGKMPDPKLVPEEGEAEGAEKRKIEEGADGITAKTFEEYLKDVDDTLSLERAYDFAREDGLWDAIQKEGELAGLAGYQSLKYFIGAEITRAAWDAEGNQKECELAYEWFRRKFPRKFEELQAYAEGKGAVLESAGKPSKNILKGWAKKARKSDRKGAKGWFVNPNAGDVPHNVAFFNKAMGSAPAEADGGVGSVAMAESAGRKLPKYEVIVKPSAAEMNEIGGDDPEKEERMRREQRGKFEEALKAAGFSMGDELKLRFFDSAFFDESEEIMSADDAIQALALKEGVDMVRFEDGKVGFVGHYGGEDNGFEILGEPTADDKAMLESAEKHEALNPELWGADGEMLPKVKEKLLKVKDKFEGCLKEDGVDVEVLDALVIGSNASYNYNKDSDIDLHVIVDAKEASEDPEMAMKAYAAYRSLFNGKYSISIHGHPVEVYVEDGKTDTVSNGVYSLSKGWVRKPDETKIPDESPDLEPELTEWEDRYFDAKEKPTPEGIDSFMKDVYEMRRESVKKSEYDKGNLIFKELRNMGFIKDLKDLRTSMESKELSLESKGLDDGGKGSGDHRDATRRYNDRMDKIFRSFTDRADAEAEWLKGQGLSDEEVKKLRDDTGLGKNALADKLRELGKWDEFNKQYKEGSLKESTKLDENTSNFAVMDSFPLLVWLSYEEVTDEAMRQVNDERGEGEEEITDWGDERLEKKVDELSRGVCALTEEEISDLKDDLFALQHKIHFAGLNGLDDAEEGSDAELECYALADAKFEIKPGYFEGYQIYVGIDEENLAESDAEEIRKGLFEIKDKYKLSEMKAVWRASNGETGFVSADSLKESKEANEPKAEKADKGEKKKKPAAKDSLRTEDGFFGMRDAIADGTLMLPIGKNYWFKDGKVRPMGKDDVKGKFIASPERRIDGRTKTPEELKKIAGDLGLKGAKAVFWHDEGAWGDEYGYLLSDEADARKVAKEFGQDAYAAYGPKGEYLERPTAEGEKKD